MTRSDHNHLVMVVDDDHGIRDALASVLCDEGYTVVCANDGKDALERLRSGVSPCLIFLDLMMPVMDGWEFRRQQNDDPAIARIPVAIITAGAPRHVPPSAEVLLSKPLNLDQVFDTLQQYC